MNKTAQCGVAVRRFRPGDRRGRRGKSDDSQARFMVAAVPPVGVRSTTLLFFPTVSTEGWLLPAHGLISIQKLDVSSNSRFLAHQESKHGAIPVSSVGSGFMVRIVSYLVQYDIARELLTLI